MRLRVSIPASAGNTGSAFDSLGIAYGLTNEVIVDTETPGRLDVEGEGAELLKKGEPNLVQQAMERFVQATRQPEERRGDLGDRAVRGDHVRRERQEDHDRDHPGPHRGHRAPPRQAERAVRAPAGAGPGGLPAQRVNALAGPDH